MIKYYESVWVSKFEEKILVFFSHKVKLSKLSTEKTIINTDISDSLSK